ncbi:MAG: hypothetical protein E7355_03180 [Clostridiales bacterium]|nr:hypothetical protein [Clostridiales bacterium]
MKRKTLKKLIVFVCTGNTCRSPMAEYIFRKKAEEMGLVKLKVASAGTHAKKGDKINEKSAEILRNKGFDTVTFQAKPVDERVLKQSLAIVCMTDAQRDMLMEMRWQVLRAAGEEEIENNVYSFSEITGYQVMDPYGKDISCYQYVYELIEGGMSALADKLLPEPIRKKLRETPKTNTTKKTAQKKPQTQKNKGVAKNITNKNTNKKGEKK